VCSNTAGGYKIHLFKMTADGKSLVMDSDKVIHQSKGSEANKLYKINGIYYHYYSEVRPEGRVAMMDRASSLEGPWESRQLNHVDKHLDKEPNQGGMIQLASGDWWFITHQGTGDWEGRAMVLLPITWTEGWPIIGKAGSDGIGSMIWQMRKPVVAMRISTPAIISPTIMTPQSNDEFDEKALPPQWEWNYQPRDDKWSLAERPGFLRLHAFKPLAENDLLKAGNTLTQRAFRTGKNEVTVKFDLTGMADGQHAGLCHFAGAWSAMGVLQSRGARTLIYNEKGKLTAGPAITSNNLWLRSAWGYDGQSDYSYSTDGKSYVPCGKPWHLTWGNYRGDRIGLFSFNNERDAGFVDIDWFHYKYDKPANVEFSEETPR
jgi:beta-xylosidase